jgi:hypothetical protein
MTEMADLIEHFRDDMFDPPLPSATDTSESMWTDSEILRFARQAQEEFCRYTLCLSDSRTFRPKIKPGDSLVKADPRIIKPKNAYLKSTGKELRLVRAAEMDEGVGISDYGASSSGNWRVAEGTPTHLITDDETGYFRLYPAPPVKSDPDELMLSVYRLPKEELELEIPEEWRIKLLDGMKAQAYNKEDIEVNDTVKADKFRLRWLNWLTEGKKSFRVFYRGSRSIAYGGI